LVLWVAVLALCNTAAASAVDSRRFRAWVLELGAGPGAATKELGHLATRVTSLDCDHAFAAKLGARVDGVSVTVVQGDAATLPLSDGTFSSAIAILMFHHLRSEQLQDLAFAEIWRVLRPAGVFLALEIPDGWLNRVGHIRSTFVPVTPASVFARLTPRVAQAPDFRPG